MERGWSLLIPTQDCKEWIPLDGECLAVLGLVLLASGLLLHEGVGESMAWRRRV